MLNTLVAVALLWVSLPANVAVTVYVPSANVVSGVLAPPLTVIVMFSPSTLPSTLAVKLTTAPIVSLISSIVTLAVFLSLTTNVVVTGVASA